MGQSICLEKRHNDNNLYDNFVFGGYSNKPNKSIVVEFSIGDFYSKKKKSRRKKSRKKIS